MFATDQTKTGDPFDWRIALWMFLGTLLAIPLIAMQFTNEVVWDRFDFVVAAALLAGVDFSIELAIRFTSSPVARRIAIAIIASGAILVWLQGAISLI